MRKLATIRTIADVQPIENADAIEVVIVDGWKVVTKKGEFQTGDLCVYFEIDSVLPVREEFEFLRKGSYVKKDWLVSESNPEGEGFRLKTIKLRGQISQGLVTPFELYMWNDDNFYVGADVTEHLGVVKWDPPVPATLSGRVRGNFPSFIPKTDQERVQNIKSHELAVHVSDTFEVTIKLDGSSMTMYHHDDKLGVCSRNLDLDWENDNDTTFAKVFQNTAMNEILPTLGNFAFQGELMGPGIQGNREKLTDHRFFLFDIYNIHEGRYLSPEERDNMYHLILDLQFEHGRVNDKKMNFLAHCPVIDINYSIAGMNVDDFLAMAEGGSFNPEITREGVVFKANRTPDFSFKVISNKFLLKNGD